MPKAGQDTNFQDPNDPYAKVRQNVLNQAGSDPTIAPPPSTPSTPSPTFTTQPVAGTTPQAQPTTPSPTFTTQPTPGGTQPATTPPAALQGTLPPGAPAPAAGFGASLITPPGTIIPGTQPNAPGTSTTTSGGATAYADPSELNKPGFVNTGGFGGGWDQSFANGLPRALQLAIANGQTGQAAIDWIKKTYPNISGADQIAYYADKGQYGLPGNLYVAPNANNKGALDLIQRPGQEGQDAGTVQSSTPLGLTSTSTSTPYADQVRKMLMDRISTLGQPLDVNDPTIQQPYDAANLAAQRQLEQGKKDTAERLYASGDLNTNAAQVADTQANEQTATGLAGVKATLIANQLSQRATQLQQLYSLAVASGDSESARQVQLELAGIQAELAREGFGVNLANIAANQNSNAVTSLI